MVGETSSAQECFDLVRQEKPIANGVSFDYTAFDAECYAVSLATIITADDFNSYETCIFQG